MVHAAGYSMSGIGYLLRSEMSARIEAVAVVLSILWFAILGRPIWNYVLLIILACVLFAVEALNTAIEVVVDEISPERSDFARTVKDLGSTAVFFLLTAGVLFLVWVTADAFGAFAA